MAADRSLRAGSGVRSRPAVAILILLAILALCGLRIAQWGTSRAAPDTAEYVYVGLNVLHHLDPVAANGHFYRERSPLYPTALAIASEISGSDSNPFGGPHALVVAVYMAGLALAVLLGWKLEGAWGAAGVGLALLACPVLWATLPQTYVDMALATMVLAAVLVTWRPGAVRWAFAGAFVGLAVLVKESAAPLVLLPLAFADAMPRREWLRLAGIYAGAAALVTVWWWILVAVNESKIFGLNVAEAVSARDVSRPFDVTPWTIATFVVLAAGWVIFALRHGSRPGGRLVLIAGLALLPAAGLAWSEGLASRQFLPIVLVSAVVAGTAFGGLWGGIARGRAGSARGGRPQPAAAAVALSVLLAVLAVHGQLTADPRVTRSGVGPLAGWLARHTEPGDSIAATFESRQQLAVYLYGRARLDKIWVRSCRPCPATEGYIWAERNYRGRVGLPQSALEATLRAPGVRYLVLGTGAHRLALPHLAALLRRDPVPGIHFVAHFGGLTAADAFAIRQRQLRPQIHLRRLVGSRVRGTHP